MCKQLALLVLLKKRFCQHLLDCVRSFFTKEVNDFMYRHMMYKWVLRYRVLAKRPFGQRTVDELQQLITTAEYRTFFANSFEKSYDLDLYCRFRCERYHWNVHHIVYQRTFCSQMKRLLQQVLSRAHDDWSLYPCLVRWMHVLCR